MKTHPVISNGALGILQRIGYRKHRGYIPQSTHLFNKNNGCYENMNEQREKLGEKCE